MEIPRHHRLKQQRYNLVGELCPNEKCEDRFIFPPRDVCPKCHSEAKIKPDEIPEAIYDRTIRLAEASKKGQIKF